MRSVSVLNARIQRSIGDRTSTLYFGVRGRYQFNPAGISDLEGSIRILAPLRDVTFRWYRGANVALKVTATTATSPYSAPLNIGDVVQDIVNVGPVLSTSIAEGDNFVDVTGSAPVAGEWYFLIDFNRLERQANTSTYRPIGGELVQVNTVEQIDSSTWNVVFYQNVGREYASGSRLSNSPNGKVLQNIGIRGLKVKGIRKRSRKSLHSFARTQTFTGTLAGRIQ